MATAIRFNARAIDPAKTAGEFARIYGDKRLKAEVEDDINEILDLLPNVMAVVPFHAADGTLKYEIDLLTGGGGNIAAGNIPSLAVAA